MDMPVSIILVGAKAGYLSDMHVLCSGMHGKVPVQMHPGGGSIATTQQPMGGQAIGDAAHWKLRDVLWKFPSGF